MLEIVLNNNNYLSFFLLFVTTTILAPLFEEIIFRGILLPTLSRDFGVISGIIISAFIFALAHLSLGEMPPLFVLGVGLAITRIASGSLFSFSDYAFFMEWIDFLKFVPIEDIKNLIFTCESNKKMFI